MGLASILLTAMIGLVSSRAAALDPSGSLGVIADGNKTYGIVPIQWVVQINNTETPYNLTVEGTTQDVLSAILKVDPAAGARINQTVSTTNSALVRNGTGGAAAAAAADDDDDALVGRSLVSSRDALYTPTQHYCDVAGWSRCSVGRIYQGISYLDGVPGQPSNGPGPGSCGRVSCSYNAAIFWCNDNLETKVLDSFRNIGDGAELVVDACTEGNRNMVDGQQFFADGWNVIVRYDAC